MKHLNLKEACRHLQAGTHLLHISEGRVREARLRRKPQYSGAAAYYCVRIQSADAIVDNGWVRSVGKENPTTTVYEWCL